MRFGRFICALVLLSCTADVVIPPVPPLSTVRDVGPMDGGDLAGDAAVQEPCPPGAEGCQCVSPTRYQLRQWNCEEGLLCVPWNVQRGFSRQYELDTCVRPCASDADCGERRCRHAGISVDGAPLNICADEETQLGGWCGMSRRLVSQVAALKLNTPGVIRACELGLFCEPFGDLHAEEGVCIQTCQSSADCPQAQPYCNPVKPDYGSCSLRRNGPGAWCGGGEGAEGVGPNRCDASAQLVCATASPGATTGFCMERCGEGGACSAPGAVCNPSLLLCSEPCSVFPDSCEGDGIGFGRQCLRGLTAPLCADRPGPGLRPARVNARGAILDVGDACAREDNTELFTCPEPSHCFGFGSPGAALSMCLVGCPLTGGDTYCQQAYSSTTARCNQVQAARRDWRFCGDGD